MYLFLIKLVLDDREHSYRYPSYHLFGASVSWVKAWNINADRKISLNVFMRGDNLFDTTYIERGKDGANHDLATFRGYWGFGRTFSFGVRIVL